LAFDVRGGMGAGSTLVAMQGGGPTCDCGNSLVGEVHGAGADAAMPFMQGGSMVCGRARSSCDGGGVSPIDGGLADDDPGGTGPGAHPLALQGDADSSLGLSRGMPTAALARMVAGPRDLTMAGAANVTGLSSGSGRGPLHGASPTGCASQIYIELTHLGVGNHVIGIDLSMAATRERLTVMTGTPRGMGTIQRLA
jgi:hypothetical protein